MSLEKQYKLMYCLKNIENTLRLKHQTGDVAWKQAQQNVADL